MPNLTILHANSNVLMINGLHTIVNNGGEVAKIVIAKNEEQLFRVLTTKHFDVLIINPCTDEVFSIETIYRLKENYPELKTLIISEIQTPQSVVRILENGVQGYLTYQCDEVEITHAIFAISKGEKFYCNKVLDIILNKSLSAREDNSEPPTLTERETEITALIARGYTNKEIGKELYLSHHTVHTHRRNILKKLGVKSVPELTIYAINIGLLNNKIPY